jgi:uncharacterized protein (DUF58 family)
VADAWLDPALAAGLGGLHLAAARVRGGLGTGRHVSFTRGAGMEFSEYRAYAPGDPLRRVDWKLFARSDRYFVREAERESALTAWLLLDTTASMAQADAARPAWTRLAAARQFAAAMITLALRDGDRIGLWMGTPDGGRHWDAAADRRHGQRLRLALASAQARGTWPAQTRRRAVDARMRAGDLVVLLSDGFDAEATAWLADLSRRGCAAILLRILAAEERDFPFRAGIELRDPESDRRIGTDAPAVRTDYLVRFAAAREAQAAQLEAAGVRVADYALDEPLLPVLRQLFAAVPRARG